VQYLRNDYLASIQLFTANYMVSYKSNYGSISSTKYHETLTDPSNSQLKWYMSLYNSIYRNLHEANGINKHNMMNNTSCIKNEHLLGKTMSKMINKKLDSRNTEIIEACNNNMELLEPIQK
jgi:hypothetical protein